MVSLLGCDGREGVDERPDVLGERRVTFVRACGFVDREGRSPFELLDEVATEGADETALGLAGTLRQQQLPVGA